MDSAQKTDQSANKHSTTDFWTLTSESIAAELKKKLGSFTTSLDQMLSRKDISRDDLLRK